MFKTFVHKRIGIPLKLISNETKFMEYYAFLLLSLSFSIISTCFRLGYASATVITADEIKKSVR